MPGYESGAAVYRPAGEEQRVFLRMDCQSELEVAVKQAPCSVMQSGRQAVEAKANHTSRLVNNHAADLRRRVF